MLCSTEGSPRVDFERIAWRGDLISYNSFAHLSLTVMIEENDLSFHNTASQNSACP
jgi:hypothetical protein